MTLWRRISLLEGKQKEMKIFQTTGVTRAKLVSRNDQEIKLPPQILLQTVFYVKSVIILQLLESLLVIMMFFCHSMFHDFHTP